MKGNLHCISHLLPKVCFVLKHTILLMAILFSLDLYSQTPTISSFTPTSAAMGNTVIITGTNFTGSTAVSFGGVAAGSFTVVSPTQINAVVPLTVSGSVSVTNPAQTATRAGFYYLPLSGIITDFAGYWPTTTASNNATYPDDSHNLLAFTYNGITYSTGVNNSLLTGLGITYSPGNFRSLPVANIAGINNGTNIFLSMAIKVDGNAAVANASAVASLTIKDVMTDGANGLNMGTGITNLPVSALMTFDIHIINPDKIFDAEPDILITQIASPSSGNDVFQFIDAAGATIGNTITQDMLMLTPLGTYSLDLFDLSPGAPFNSATGFSVPTSPIGTNTTREIRLAGFKLSDFGITAANYTQIAALKITPSGSSDYAFIAFNTDAIEMAPNISINVQRTNSSICAGGTANLEVIASAAYGGALTYSWEVSTNGGSSWSPVSDGGGISGATTKRLSIVSATHNNKYRATVTESGTGFSSVCDIFTILVITPSAPTSVSISSSTTTCLNNHVSFTSTVGGGSNLFYQWQTNASGAYVDIPDAILNIYQPPVNATGVISYRLKVSSGSGCGGVLTSTARTITVVGISSVTPASRCGTGTVSLTVAATSGTISWYAASSGGSALTTGTTYSPSISASTTYYVSTNVSQCTTGGRVPVTATINSMTWAGTNTTDWSTLANWDCGGTPPSLLPTRTSNVRIPTFPTGGRFPTVSVTAPVNNITISPSASIIVASAGVFEIYGAISNSGTFTATSGTISMRGASQQTIPANAFSTNTIKNLIINNGSGVLLGGALNLTGTLTPTTGTLTTYGYLTLISNAAGTAMVAQGTGTYIFGNVNVERYMPDRRAWRLMTAPLTNSNSIYQSWQNNGVYASGKGMLITAPGGGPGIDSSGKSSFKSWNTTRQLLQAVSNSLVPISSLNSGSADNTGYFVFVRGDRYLPNIDPQGIKKNITTLTSKGYLQTGTQNFTGLSTAASGFSLIGNPYASPVDLNLILSNSGTTNVKRKFYTWDPQLNSVGGYVALDDVVTPGVFLPTPGSSSQGNYIQSGQAFFVMTNTTGSAVVQIKETNKAVTSNNLIFGRPAGNIETFVTNLYLLDTLDGSTISADGTRADFNNAFGEGIDDNDNLKYFNVNETFGFIRNNVFLATERRPSIINKDTLFFKLAQSAKRSYQFQFIATNFNDPSITHILEDSYTGLPIPLDANGITKVNFVINADAASKAANRFRVVFSKSSPLPVTFSVIKAYRQNENIAVEWKVENEINISKYEVERSADGGSFTKINTTAATGTNLLSVVYKWIDADIINGYNFYRIKSIGLDGKNQYSQLVKVWAGQNDPAISVYPNPVPDKLMSVQFQNQPAGTYKIKMINTAGHLLMEKTLDHAGGTDKKDIRLPGTIKTGNYLLSIVSKDFIKRYIKVFVQ